MSAEATITEPQVLDALRAVQDPDLHKDIVSLGFIKNLRICGDSVAFQIELTTPACPVKDLMKPQMVTVRLYVLTGHGLTPKDMGPDPKSDPFLKIKLGKTHLFRCLILCERHDLSTAPCANVVHLAAQ